MRVNTTLIRYDDGGIEGTAQMLEEQMQRLEAQKRGLDRELAAVAAHLQSVRGALDILRKLTSVVCLTGDATEQQSQSDVAAASSASLPIDVVEGAEELRPLSAGSGVSGMGGYGRLTEQILEYLSTLGDAEVRARDVAAALGRDATAGSINAVRSTLDRLVGNSRAVRAGRGLYRAAP
ncbi:MULTISPECIES: hypothetical protein [unclassified Streptomyces]|uniref:hypothetical protein n=1 Tax=unclassified Streptomyces TaxID=2593676 RepID=UPI0037F7E9ED